jgi:G:T-mismatch repair DNA endonuclease (very short patch repair protein)
LAKICSVDGCKGEHNAKGFCDKHYRKWRRHGDPLGIADPKKTAEKISNALTGMPKSIEHRENLSKSVMGRPSPRKGVTLLDSTKEKISKKNKGKLSAFKGKKHSPKTKEILRIKATGRKDSEETKKKKSIAHNRPETKRKNSEAHIGKKHSEKSKQKMSVSQNKPETLQKNRDRRAKQVFPKEDTKPEKIVQAILKKHKINFQKHFNFKLKSGKNHQADIVIEPNHVIEVFGDYWHFNPKKYDGESIQKMRKKEIKVKEVWQEDKDIINGMEEQSYKVLVVWELELKDELEKTTKKILKFVKA